MNSETLTRLRTIGLKAAMPTELLAYAVSKTDDDVDRWVPVARELLLANRKLRKLADLSLEELQKEFDLSRDAAERLMAMFILGQKVGIVGRGEMEVESINDPADAADLLDDLRQETQEHFVAIYLDAKNVILVSRSSELTVSPTAEFGTSTMASTPSTSSHLRAIAEPTSALFW